MSKLIGRRGLLFKGAALASTLALEGCTSLSRRPSVRQLIHLGEDANLFIQRLLLTPAQLAPEYPESAISRYFKPNGTSNPTDAKYRSMAGDDFKAFRLKVDGLVERELDLSLAELRKRPSRTQITRHDCVEGWSCIGKWTGVPVSDLLNLAGLKPAARYIVFHCADDMAESNAEKSLYYESVDLVDAFHPQTILAYEMNDHALPVQHGAPLRVRIERQLGYKMAKYVMRMEVVSDMRNIGGGKGGYWEDNGYDWYAGI